MSVHCPLCGVGYEGGHSCMSKVPVTFTPLINPTADVFSWKQRAEAAELQNRELQKKIEQMLKMDPGHTCWATMNTTEKEALIEQRDKAYREVDAANRLNGELLKTLGSAIQYVAHDTFGHLRNEETLEIRHDESCFKCKALKVYFNAESQQTEKRKEPS